MKTDGNRCIGTTLWNAHPFSFNKTIIHGLADGSSVICHFGVLDGGLLVDSMECVVWKQRVAQGLAGLLRAAQGGYGSEWYGVAVGAVVVMAEVA